MQQHGEITKAIVPGEGGEAKGAHTTQVHLTNGIVTGNGEWPSLNQGRRMNALQPLRVTLGLILSVVRTSHAWTPSNSINICTSNRYSYVLVVPKVAKIGCCT